MPGTTYDIILGGPRPFPVPMNFRPGYDMNYVRSYQQELRYSSELMIEMTQIEMQYDGLSVIGSHETPQQWALRVRGALQKLLSTREYSFYHMYCLYASTGNARMATENSYLTYYRPSVHKSQMAICFDCWKLVRISDVKPKKTYFSGWRRYGYEVKSEDLMKLHLDNECSKAK